MKQGTLGKFVNIDDIVATAKRFPLSCLCILICSLIFTGLLYDILESKDFIASVILPVCVLGYFWFGGLAVCHQSRPISLQKYGFIAAIGLLVLYIISFGLGEFGGGTRVVAVVGSLVAFVTYAPFIRGGYHDDDFWVYNRRLWFGVFFSCLAAILFYAGVALAIQTMQYLFDIDLGEKIFGVTVIVCFSILAPLYSLSFVPQTFNEGAAECHSPKPMTFFVSWLLIPLILFYLFILYAYFIKAGVAGEIFKNQVIYMIAGFAGLGVFGYLVSWPLHKNGAAIITLFQRIIFPVLLIPTGVMAYSIYVRIHDYGITENRYIIVLIGIWLAVIIAAKLWGCLRLWHIIALLSLLFFMGSWGPWSIYNMSIASQESRLESVLTRNGLLDNAAIIPAKDPAKIPQEDKVQISSIYDYLISHHTMEKDNAIYGYRDRAAFFNAMNIDYIAMYDRQNYNATGQQKFRYAYNRSDYNDVIAVSGYDYYVHSVNLNDGKTYDLVGVGMTFSLSDNIITLATDGGNPMKINMDDFTSAMDALRVKDGQNENDNDRPDDFVINADNQSYAVTLRVRNVSGFDDGIHKRIEYMGVSILIREK